MDASFWHQKWESGDIGFHESGANHHLVKHFCALFPTRGSRVFVPLCGKTLDIHWFLAQGYRVVGAELNPSAVEQLFQELGVAPEILGAGALTHYRAEGIDIFVGDIFDLTGRTLGPVNAVYDRAALVALPETMRARYTAHVAEISAGAPQLLICYEYVQSLVAGPPFSIGSDEVHRHYAQIYAVSLLERSELPGGLKGKYDANEYVWLLEQRNE